MLKEFLLLFTILSVFTVAYLGGFLVESDETTQQEELTQQHVQQLQEQFSPPTLTCQQLFGDDKRFPDARPQVECEADREGYFFWQDQDEAGEWLVFYYNQYPTSITGFMFSTNPEFILITFKDMAGNESEAMVQLLSDFKPCSPANGCFKV